MLKVLSLSYAFATRKLFRDVTFQLAPGDILHLRGGNGVGKSTLLAVIAGLRSPCSGEVTWESPSGESCSDRRQILGYLGPEANGLYLKMDARANLCFWSQLRGGPASPATIDATLQAWGLGHRLLRQDFPVGQFSTGMRRRLGLARLSLCGAPCWLLDEPVYGLDGKGVLLLQEALAAHQDRGGVAIVVSHDEAPLKDLTTCSYELSPA